MKNNKNSFGARKPKIYEVDKNNEIDGRTSKVNDIKHEKNIKKNSSYRYLDNIQIFNKFSRTSLTLFINFTSFLKSTKSRLFKPLTLCVITHGLRWPV